MTILRNSDLIFIMRRFAASGHCVAALRAAQNTTNFDVIAPDGCRDIGEYLGISVI
jgi:hypothetical protein